MSKLSGGASFRAGKRRSEQPSAGISTELARPLPGSLNVPKRIHKWGMMEVVKGSGVGVASGDQHRTLGEIDANSGGHVPTLRAAIDQSRLEAECEGRGSGCEQELVDTDESTRQDGEGATSDKFGQTICDQWVTQPSHHSDSHQYVRYWIVI